MIKYIENRIWALNAEIINTEADVLVINQQLREKITDGLFGNGGLHFSYSENPIGNYSCRPVEITLEMNERSLPLYQQMIDEKGILFHASSFRMIVNTFGFLNVVPVLEFTGTVTESNLTDIETNGDAAAELVDAFFGDIAKVIDVLDEIGVIKKSGFYHFGIPLEIEKYKLHTKDDSYNYTVHMFFFNEPDILKDIVRCYQAENRSMTYAEHKFYFIFPLYFWEMDHQCDDNKLIEQISIDSYLTSELVSTNNALHVYNSFLHVINQNKDVDSNKLRQIFNFNTWQIQSLRLFNPNFTLYQFRYIKMYRENSDLIPKYDLLKDAEKALSFAIEGMEVNKTQQSERVMQFILALFTALTLYSVITDVYALITSSETKVAFSIHSLQTIIFIFETVIILAFILFFKKMSRKL
jgi:hypothetical protein